MSEASGQPEEEPQIDLNKLRDDVLAGRETGHSGPDFSKMTEEERQAWRPPHFVDPALHPEIDFSKDPDIEELRKIAREKQAGQTEQEPHNESSPNP